MDKQSNEAPRHEDQIPRDQFTVVLEQINSKIDLLVDGHKLLKQEIELFKADTESNFRSVADYLARIEAEVHGELKTKVNVKEFGSLQKRVERLEHNWRLQCLSGTKS